MNPKPADRIKLADLSGGEPMPVLRGDSWQVQPTRAGRRLAIGTAGSPVELMLDLARSWQGGIGLLYVLLVPRLGRREPGRYQAPGPLSFDDAAGFCRRFRDFLETDGRHHLWLAAPGGGGLLVYDRHEILYLYGEVDAAIGALASRGFVEGPVDIPAPHGHVYHAEFDVAEDEVLAWCDWAWSPLREGQDD